MSCSHLAMLLLPLLFWTGLIEALVTQSYSSITTKTTNIHLSATGITTISLSQGTTLAKAGPTAPHVRIVTSCLTAVLDPTPSAVCRYPGHAEAPGQTIVNKAWRNGVAGDAYCAQACLTDSSCQGFLSELVNESGYLCKLYNSGGNVSDLVQGGDAEFYQRFYDRDCYACPSVAYSSITSHLTTITTTLRPHSSVPSATTFASSVWVSTATYISTLNTTVTPTRSFLPAQTQMDYCRCAKPFVDVPNGSPRCGYGGYAPNGLTQYLNDAHPVAKAINCLGYCLQDEQCQGIVIERDPGQGIFCNSYYGGNLTLLAPNNELKQYQHYYDRDCIACTATGCVYSVTSTSIYYSTPLATPGSTVTQTTTTTATSLPSASPTLTCRCARSEQIMRPNGTMCDVIGHWTSDDYSTDRNAQTPEECSLECYNSPGCSGFNLDPLGTDDPEQPMYYACDKYFSSPPEGEFVGGGEGQYYSQDCFQCAQVDCTKTITARGTAPT